MATNNKASAEIFDLGNNVWRIVEKNTVNIYLVVGSAKAMLIDTGYGKIDLLGIVSNITTLPLIVVNTHAHPDHSGGNDAFGAIHAHKGDFEGIRHYSSRHGFSLEALNDNDSVDLGNREIEIVHAPGHTAGSICLYDKAHKFLFTADTCNRMTWLFLDVCVGFPAYYQSLLRLRKYIDDDLVICPGHNEEAGKKLLEDCVECARKILAGEKGVPYTYRPGKGLEVTHESVTIVYDPDTL